MNNTTVDSYLSEGCGRCQRFRTPACKVHRWVEPLTALRALVREAGLTEAMKWGMPCYTVGGKNVAMVAAFNERCTLSFFRGTELADPDAVLEPAGPNAKMFRQVNFVSVTEVVARRDVLLRLLGQAIELERAGGKPKSAPTEEALPAELAAALAADPALARAFAALTPGRRRSHALHVGGARQAATRARRAEQCAAAILAGRGWNERDPALRSSEPGC